MGTFEGQLAGWFDADAVPRTEAQAHAAVTELVHQYSATLYRVAYSVTRNAGDAEDVVQETFLRVLRHCEKLNELRDTRVWLVRIAWNLVLDRKRRSKARPEAEDIDDLVRVLPAKDRAADEEMIATQGHARILRLIDELPAKEREVLLLSAIDELSTVEIAGILGTTESTIRSRIFRARRMLGGKLEEKAGNR
ncbi:MAG TPA: RNA polymerase sigma factor [Acidobacteriaceae bacterium]|jgi:RNA polymerase sigma-70 factor (ECF subfamily)|nr:RNA polymerase sigma factor [Acidobacteriaceae bacterium]